MIAVVTDNVATATKLLHLVPVTCWDISWLAGMFSQ